MPADKIITDGADGYIYRGFRLRPNFTSSSGTGRIVQSRQGWTCPTYRQDGMSRCAWYSTLEGFTRDVDDTYTLAAEGKARSDRKAALLRAADNLSPNEAALVRTLVAECNEQQEAAEAARQAAQAAADAAYEARKRLHDAAPDLLAALQTVLRAGFTSNTTAQALAAIARATQP